MTNIVQNTQVSKELRAFTSTEVANKISSHLIGIVRYWATVKVEEYRDNDHERLEGMIHSCLCLFDGSTMAMCAVDISINDKEDRSGVINDFIMHSMLFTDLTDDDMGTRLLRGLKGYAVSASALEELSLEGKGLAMFHAIMKGLKDAGCLLRLCPHEDDKDYYISQGENWLECNQIVDVSQILADFEDSGLFNGSIEQQLVLTGTGA